MNVDLGNQSKKTILRRSRLRLLIPLASLLLIAMAAVAIIVSVGNMAEGYPGSHSYGKAAVLSWLFLGLMVVLLPAVAIFVSKRKIHIELDENGLHDPYVGSERILWKNISVATLKSLAKGAHFVSLTLKEPQSMTRFGMKVIVQEAMIGTLGLEVSPRALLEIVEQMTAKHAQGDMV